MKDKIFRIFSSSIKIRITGRNVNNFIRKLIRYNINMEKVIPISYKQVDIIINYKELEKVYKIKSIYDINIIRYYGNLKLIKLIKKNVFIFSFLVLGLFMIYILSNIIFSIDIIHSNSKIVELLRSELSYYDIKKYSFAKSYDEIEKIEGQILNNNKDSLEWLEIIREGTKYIIRVEERIVNENIAYSNNYDVIATKNAVIKYIIAESGEKIKDVNTYVKKGDVVISSSITMPNNEKVFSSARGKVIGETWYTVDTEYPYYYNEVLYTGNKKKVLVFNFINKRLSLFNFNRYKTFDKNVKYIYENNFIPVSLSYEYQYETEVVNDVYTYDETKEKAIELAKEKLIEKYESIIEINKVTILKEEDLGSKIKLSLFITAEEDITEYREVSIEKKRDELS